MSNTLHHVRSVKDKHVAMTGWFFWPRWEIVKELRKRGAIIDVRSRVRQDTEILFRGNSGVWKYGDYGLNEQRLAHNITKGQAAVMIYEDELERWLTRGRMMTPADVIAGEAIEDLEGEYEASLAEYDWDALEDPEIGVSIKSGDSRATTRVRREQGLIRSMLFRGRGHAVCDLCGERLPRPLLVVAHIKPRRYCSRAERNDVPTVVMLACQLGCDALYERGWISVDESGRVLVSGAATGKFGVGLRKRYRGKRFPGFTSERDEYFLWHRRYRFQ